MKSKQPVGPMLESSASSTNSNFINTSRGMDTMPSISGGWPFIFPQPDPIPILSEDVARERLRIRAQGELEDLWNGYAYNHRYKDGYNRNTAVIYHHTLLSIGKQIAVWAAGDREDIRTLISILNCANFGLLKKTRKQVIQRIITSLEEHCRVHGCNHCGVAVADENSTYVQDEDEYICEGCRSDHYCWSAPMDSYIRNNDAQDYYPNQRSWERRTPEKITNDFANDEGLEWSDYAEAFYNADEVALEDHFDDSCEEDENDGLADYHDTSRDFEIYQLNPNTLYKNMPPLGVEIEVYSESRYSAIQSMRSFKPIGQIILERDGSLSEECGFEIITDPLGYDEWKDMGPRLCKHAAKYSVAYNHPDENDYGIHITLDRSYLSPLQEARLFLFMTAEENLAFMRAIAQRNGIYSARMDIGSLNKARQTITTLGGLDSVYNHQQEKYHKKILGAGKYAPINFKGHLAEIRIFQATLHAPSFMKNLEFVWAMVEWLRASTGTLWHHEDFVKWLGQRSVARHDYANLYDYLIRPTYRIKDYGFVIRNTWVKHLTVPKPIKGVLYVPPQPANDSLVAA